MFISCAQNKILKSFTCERLSSNPENKNLILNFTNNRNPKLVKYLQKSAWQEDVSGECAHYLIKQGDEIALYFAIRTGSLFNKPINEAEFIEMMKSIANAINLKNKVFENVESKEDQLKILSKYNLHEISIPQLEELMQKYYKNKNILAKDREKDLNQLLYHVDKTYPALELFIFCSNDSFKSKWSSYGFSKNQRMGMIFFWKFIIQKIFEVQQVIGCKFFYLFAADGSEDSSLVSYYNMLHFEQNYNYGTNKPFFDLTSRFMLQEINELKFKKYNFFYNFNPDEDIPEV